MSDKIFVETIILSYPYTIHVYILVLHTYITIDNEERPKCIIYLKTLADDSMVPSKLKRYLEINHSTLNNKSRDYFLRQLAK
jgi:uncharacterized protein (UPF0147 family)